MNNPHLNRSGSIAASVFIGSALLLSANFAIAQNPGTFNQSGNILITDQFNNRVIEIDPAGNIVCQFGGGPANVGPTAIVGTNDAERVGGLTLMSGTGIPAGASPACPSTCIANRALRLHHHRE